MTTVIEHLERFCGPIVGGWAPAPEIGIPFQVVRLERGPIAETITFATVGLSSRTLRSAASQKLIRHELVMIAKQAHAPHNIPGILQQVGAAAISDGAAYLRGEVISRQGELFPQSKLRALYVSQPVYFPEEFFSATIESLGKVIFAWLVPITVTEMSYVKSTGWSSFEDLLVRRNPDLTDLSRSSVLDD